jgi:Fe2+ transport system protein B
MLLPQQKKNSQFTMTTVMEYYHLQGSLTPQNVSFSDVKSLDVCKRKRRVNWKQWYGDCLLLLLFWLMFFGVVVRLGIVQISNPMVDVRTGVRNRSTIRTGDVD